MRTLALLLALGLAAPAHAQFFGTVTGTISAVDGRTNPYGGFTAPVSGARQTFGGTPALEEVLVRLMLVSSAGATIFWTRTDENGRYTIPWTSPLASFAMVVEVRAMRPRLGEGEVSDDSDQPPFEFRITTAGVSNVVLGSQTLSTGSNGTVRTANFSSTVASEVIDAYRTAREVYAMFSAQVQPTSGSIRADMRGLNIFANASVVPGTNGGVAPSATEVLLVPGSGSTAPFVVAHEIGHILQYRSLDVGLPPALPPDYERDAPFVSGAWSDFSSEFERAAFQEGFAHLVGGMWMWVRSATPADGPPAFPGDGGMTSLELPGQRPDSGTVCTSTVTLPGQAPITLPLGHRRATCIARGLWDIVDRPPTGEDDAIPNRDLGDVVATLRGYPRNCIGNGCATELGQDNGVNWMDFRRAFQGRFVQTLFGIETANGLQSSAP